MTQSRCIRRHREFLKFLPMENRPPPLLLPFGFTRLHQSRQHSKRGSLIGNAPLDTARMKSRRNSGYVPPPYRSPPADSPVHTGDDCVRRTERDRKREALALSDKRPATGSKKKKKEKRISAMRPVTIDSSLVIDLRTPIITPPSVYHEVTRMTRYRGQRGFSVTQRRTSVASP